MPYFLILLALLVSTDCFASDLFREARIAEQMRAAQPNGEIIQLEADGVLFIALETRAQTPRVQGAVILLHDMGKHPDDAGVIHLLRTHLPEYGWDVLALQAPIAAADARREEYQELLPEALPRIRAAIAFLTQRKITNLVLAGHGLGANMIVNAYAGDPVNEIRALVMMGVLTSVTESSRLEAALLADLGQIKQPVLDIFGGRDPNSAPGRVTARKTAARTAGNEGYRQYEMSGGGHDFRGLEWNLINRTGKWINAVAPGVEIEGR